MPRSVGLESAGMGEKVLCGTRVLLTLARTLMQEQLRRDFERLMRERFLSGGDAAFVDYSTIDDDDTLDNSKIAEQDAADAYFDAD